MRDYEAPLKQFFSDAEYKQISKLGGLQKNVESLAKSLQKTQKDLLGTFEGKLLNSSPQEIFNKIYKPNNIGEIRELKRVLSNNKDVFKSFQIIIKLYIFFKCRVIIMFHCITKPIIIRNCFKTHNIP